MEGGELPGGKRGLIINGGKCHRIVQNFPYYLGEGLCKDIFLSEVSCNLYVIGGIQITCLEFRWCPWFVVGNFLSSSDDRSTCDFAHLILSSGLHHCLPRCCDCKEQEKKPSADSSVNEYGAQSCIEAISKHIQYMTVHEMLTYAYLKICVYIEYMIRE